MSQTLSPSATPQRRRSSAGRTLTTHNRRRSTPRGSLVAAEDVSKTRRRSVSASLEPRILPPLPDQNEFLEILRFQVSIGKFEDVVSSCEAACTEYTLPPLIQLVFAIALRRTNRFRSSLAILKTLMEIQFEPECVRREYALCDSQLYDCSSHRRQQTEQDVSVLVSIARFYLDQLDDEMAYQVLLESRFQKDGWTTAPAAVLVLLAEIERRSPRKDSFRHICTLLASETLGRKDEIAIIAKILTSVNLELTISEVHHPLAYLRLADSNIRSGNLFAAAVHLRLIDVKFRVPLHLARVDIKHLTVTDFSRSRLLLVAEALTFIILRIGPLPNLLFYRANFHKAVGCWRDAANDFDLLASMSSYTQYPSTDDDIAIEFDQLVYLKASLIAASKGFLDKISVAQSLTSSMIRAGSSFSVDMMCLKADIARETGSSISEVLQLYDNAAALDKNHIGIKLGRIYAQLYSGDCVSVATRIISLARDCLSELARRWRDCYLINLNQVIMHPMPDAFASGDLMKLLEREFLSAPVRHQNWNPHWRRLRSFLRAVILLRKCKSRIAVQLSILSHQLALVVLAVAEAHFRDGALMSSRRALRIAQSIDPYSGSDLQFSIAITAGSVNDIIAALSKSPNIVANAKYPLFRFHLPSDYSFPSAELIGDDHSLEDNGDDQLIYDDAMSVLQSAHDSKIDWRMQMLLLLLRIQDPEFMDNINRRVSNLKKRQGLGDRRLLSFDLIQRSLRLRPVSLFWATTNLSLAIMSADLPDARLARAQFRILDGAIQDVGAAVSLTEKLHPPPMLHKAWQTKLVALRVLYGTLLYRSEAHEECDQVLSSALDLDPGHQKALHIRSLCRVKLGHLHEAAKDLRSIKQHDNRGMKYLLGQISLKLGRIDDAYECFHYCIQHNMDLVSPKLLLAIGESLVLREQYVEAVVYLTRCIRADPNCSAAYQLLGDSNVHLKRFEEASNSFTSLIRLNPTSSEAYRHRGCARLAEGNAMRASEDLNRAQILAAADFTVLLPLAIAQIMNGNTSDAIDVASRCLQMQQSQAEMYLIRGLGFSLLLKWQHAIEDYTQCLSLEPGNVVCLLAKAYALYQMSKYQAAAYDYTSILEVDPGNLVALANRGAIYELCMNGIPSGMNDLNLAGTLDPTGFRVALLKALALRRRNLLTDSLDQFNCVLRFYRASETPGVVDIDIAHNCMGVMLAKMASDSTDTNEKKRILNLRHALVHFQKAAARPTLRSIAMQNTGQILTQLGRPNEALVAFEKSADTGSQNALIANNFAVALQRCGNTLQALKWMRIALAASPDNPDFSYNLGAILTAMGSWRDAVSVLDHTLNLTSNASTYNNRGVCLQALGQLETAVSDYSKAIDLNPDYFAPRWNRMLVNATRMDFRMALCDIAWLRAKSTDDAVSQKAILDRLFSYCQSWQFALRVLTIQMAVAMRKLPPLSLIYSHANPAGIILDTTICDPKNFGISSSPEHRELIESVARICDRSVKAIIIDACQHQASRKVDRVLQLLLQAVYSVPDESLRAKLIAWRCVLIMQRQGLEAVEAELAPVLANRNKLLPSYSGLVNLAGLIRQSRGDNEGALSMFALAHRCDPENVFPLMNSAGIFQQMECYFEAFQHIVAAINIVLRNPALTKTQLILVETLHTYSITIQNGTKHWVELDGTQSVLAKALHDVVHDSRNARNIYNVTRQVDQVIEEYLNSFDAVLDRHGSLEEHNTEDLDDMLASSLARMEQTFQENCTTREQNVKGHVNNNQRDIFTQNKYAH